MTEVPKVAINFFIPPTCRTTLEELAGSRQRKSVFLIELIQQFEGREESPREIYKRLFGHYPLEKSDENEGESVEN